MKTFSFYLEDSVAEALEAQAKTMGITPEDLVRFRVGEYVQYFVQRAPSTAAPAEKPAGVPPISQKDMGFNGYCVACLRVVKLPENVEQFTCPHCGALQSMAGEILATAKPEYTGLRTPLSRVEALIPRIEALMPTLTKQMKIVMASIGQLNCTSCTQKLTVADVQAGICSKCEAPLGD